MFGLGTTVKLTPLLSTPAALMITFPVVAAEGTVATIVVADQLVVLAVTPLNLTVLLPFVAPKLVPEMVTDAPTAPDVGDKPLILGAGKTVKFRPLLALPAIVTTTFPVVAPAGTVATMLVALQVLTVAVLPLNLTVLLPWVVPNPDPAIVTEALMAPEFGDRFEMVGAATASVEIETRHATAKTPHFADRNRSRSVDSQGPTRRCLVTAVSENAGVSVIRSRIGGWLSRRSEA
jgi:hypothetical protein